jgi:hypothetical protein
VPAGGLVDELGPVHRPHVAAPRRGRRGLDRLDTADADGWPQQLGQGARHGCRTQVLVNGPLLERQEDGWVGGQARRQRRAGPKQLEQQDDRRSRHPEALHLGRRPGERPAGHRRVVDQQHAPARSAHPPQRLALVPEQGAPRPHGAAPDLLEAQRLELGCVQGGEIAARGPQTDNQEWDPPIGPPLRESPRQTLHVGRLLVEAAEAGGQTQHLAQQAGREVGKRREQRFGRADQLLLLSRGPRRAKQAVGQLLDERGQLQLPAQQAHQRRLSATHSGRR